MHCVTLTVFRLASKSGGKERESVIREERK